MAVRRIRQAAWRKASAGTVEVVGIRKSLEELKLEKKSQTLLLSVELYLS